MAYRNPMAGSWPTWFSTNDLAALKAIWGEEADATSILLPQKMIGSAINDKLTGGEGPDLLRGELGHDLITGGGGADELWGGPGSNQFFSPVDGVADWLLISRDGSTNKRRNRSSVDEISALGFEDQVGILGAVTRRVRLSPTLINSTAYGQLDGIGIFVGKRLEAVYTGSEISRAELRDLTVGLPASYTGDLG